jgi:hypothetical protein
MDLGTQNDMLALCLPAFLDVVTHCVEELERSPLAFRRLEFLGEIASQIHIRSGNQVVLES